MTDATAGGGRGAVEERIVQKSLEDGAFRQQLLADPTAAVEQELGTPLPGGVNIMAVEETAHTVYLVVPRAAHAGGERKASSRTKISKRWPAAGPSGLRPTGARRGPQDTEPKLDTSLRPKIAVPNRNVFDRAKLERRPIRQSPQDNALKHRLLENPKAGGWAVDSTSSACRRPVRTRGCPSHAAVARGRADVGYLEPQAW